MKILTIKNVRVIQSHLLLVFSVFFILAFYLNSPVEAHPGRTDSSGGHTCRTNCNDWGYNYGEYHYHDSYSATDPEPTPELNAQEPESEEGDLGWLIPTGIAG